MNSSNEFNRVDYDNEHHVYDVKENINQDNNSKDDKLDFDERFKYNIMSDSGDVIDSPNNNNNDEKMPVSETSQLIIDQFDHNEEKLLQSFVKLDNSMTINEYRHYNFDYLINQENKSTDLDNKIIAQNSNINLPKRIDFKDLNPYEPSSSQLSMDKQSEENNQNTLLPAEFSHTTIKSNSTSTNLIYPQSFKTEIKSLNSFQQFWSLRIYLSKLIHLNKQKTLWPLVAFMSKFIRNLLHYFCSITKRLLQYNTILFSFCYILGSLFGMNAYLFIDFLLILICIISMLAVTYEKWLFAHYINSNGSNTQLNNIDNRKQYSKRTKLIIYGFGIGILSSFIV